jgi:preprotein translocase subunit SecE
MAENKAVSKTESAAGTPAGTKAEKKSKKADAPKKVPFGKKVKNLFGRIAKYFKDTKSELKKVVWPTKTETRNNTVTVLVVVLIAAVFMIVLDLIFGGIIHLMIG